MTRAFIRCSRRYFQCQIMQLKLPRCPNWDMVLAKNGLREEKSVGFSVSSWKYSDDFAVI